MNYAVECECGNIFVTKKDNTTQCKCGKRFDIGSHGISIPSLNKSSIIKNLKKIIQKQNNVITELIQNSKDYHESMSEIIKELR